MFTHFIGFRGDEYNSAVRIWGKPDVIHRVWDKRAVSEIADDDVAIFAKYGPDWRPTEFTFDDSAVF